MNYMNKSGRADTPIGGFNMLNREEGNGADTPGYEYVMHNNLTRAIRTLKTSTPRNARYPATVSIWG